MPEKNPHRCQEIRDRVDKWEKYWTINRSLYYEWIDFVLGDQWREDESKLFERYNKIPLMNNKLGVLFNHLIGEMIQNTPNLQILPDDTVPVEAADIRSAIVRDITLNSDAKTVYQTAYGQAVIGGYGAFRVGLEYEEDSFDLLIKQYAIDDPNCCYWDLSAKHVCKIDGMFAGFRTRLSRKKFRDKWGIEVESQIGSSAITEDSTIAFADDDSITQVDDYERVGERVTRVKLSDGTVLDESDLKKMEKIKINGKKWLINNDMPVTKVDEREYVRYKIKHTQIAGDFVLEEEELPVTLLPVIFVDQKSYYTKQGQQITRSFFKDAKDPQKYLNYLATQSAYIMKISRYDQFIMPRKCAAYPDTQQQWRDPSVVNGALYYDETPSGEKPEQLRPPELSQSLLREYERTLMDIQSGTGMYNTQLGELGNEVSGTAIEARTQRGVKNTLMPRTSLDVAVAASGEITNELIPYVYPEERSMMLSMPDMENKKITVNQAVDPYGIQVKNDIRKGKFKIRLKPGPSYEGQKEQALTSLQLVLQADKSGQVFPMIADLFADNLPLDNTLEIRNRLRTLVPPEIMEAGKTGKPLPPKPPQPSPDMIMVQLKQQELQHKAQQAQQDYQLSVAELQAKEKELQLKALQTHQDMTMQLEKLEAEKQEAAAALQETLLRYEAEHTRIQADMEMAKTDGIIKLLTHKSKQHETKNI